ncbi:hypothetical protein MMC16_004643 [Acarospora aff. strigata]|nr:hypothetical protein [Acarospora aff. strigata]
MAKKEREKQTFFDQLYQLDQEDDNLEEINPAALILRKSRTLIAETVVAVTPHPKGVEGRINARSSSHIIRTVSAPLPTVQTPFCKEVERIQDSPAALTPTAVNERVQIDRTVRSKGARGTIERRPAIVTETSDMSGKRKRGKSVQVLPQAQQIFRGLQFFFVPNNDVAPARRMRINKALEYGASWIQTWREGITHVIVDKNIKYKDVLSFLKITSLPANVTIVNELYPAECIMFRFLIDADQSHYQVEGYKETLAAKDSVSSAPPSSVSSLPLKHDKSAFVKPPETPSRTEESVQELPIAEHVNLILGESVTDNEGATTTGLAIHGPKDALDEAIEQAKALEHLALDSDEDDTATKSVTNVDSESELSDSEQQPRKAKKASNGKSWQSNFSCMQKHDGEDNGGNPNSRTIEVLQEMADYYHGQIQDHFRTTAYRKAIAALRKQTNKITTKEEASAITFIGERLALKIEEIVWTNRLRRLDNTRLEPADEVLQKFLNIYGVGFSQASKWVSQGHKSLSDLLTHAHLSTNQKIGIAHYSDFLSRIPRAEVEVHGATVRTALHNIDKDIHVIIGGSYRRGATDSGDIDLIITKPDTPIHYVRTLLLDTVIPQLFRQNFLQAALATTSRATGTKWHGASALPGSGLETPVWRRIDFLLVPWDEMGAALIYFTGNDIFNRSIRLLASKKGMRLNQHGLWRDVIRGENRERVTQGNLVEGKSERKIFEVLGVPWRPAEHRIC